MARIGCRRLAAHSGCSSARMRAKSHGTDSSFVGAHNVFVTCLPNETAGPEPSFPRHCVRTTSGLRSCKSPALKVSLSAHRTSGAHRTTGAPGAMGAHKTPGSPRVPQYGVYLGSQDLRRSHPVILSSSSTSCSLTRPSDVVTLNILGVLILCSVGV